MAHWCHCSDFSSMKWLVVLPLIHVQNVHVNCIDSLDKILVHQWVAHLLPPPATTICQASQAHYLLVPIYNLGTARVVSCSRAQHNYLVRAWALSETLDSKSNKLTISRLCLSLLQFNHSNLFWVILQNTDSNIFHFFYILSHLQRKMVLLKTWSIGTYLSGPKSRGNICSG